MTEEAKFTPKVEIVEIDRLVPYELNAKKHNPEQVDRLAEQIKRYGFDQPVVLWPIPGTKQFSIIKGHGRRLAMMKLGMEKIPAVIQKHLSREQADAMRIADNALSSIEYDTKLLAEETKRLMETFDLDAFDFGFSAKDEKLFLSIDTHEIDLDALTTDVSEAMRVQKEEDAERVSKMDDEDVRLNRIFGVSSVSTRDGRSLTRLLATLEAETGKEGIAALIAHAETYGA